jgi:hypothetical protein
VAGEQPGNPEESHGGTGGEILADPRHTRADAKLIQRAIRERWPIPESLRPKMAERLGDIIDNKSTADRDVIAAIRTLVSADRLNIDQERLELERERQHGTEEGTVKAAMDLDDAEAALDEHKPAERPE